MNMLTMPNFCKKKIPHVWKKMQLHIPDSCLKIGVVGLSRRYNSAGPFSWNPSVDCRVARVFFQPRTCDGRMVPIRQCTRPKIAGETLAGVDSVWSQGFVLQVDQNVHHSLLARSSMRCNS